MAETGSTPPEEPSSSPPLPISLPPPRILVVDDDHCVRLLNARVLQQSGYQVDAAADGAAAWDALNTDSYDLLVTDHNMPKVTGVELLKKLRAAHMGLPVILATGSLPLDEFAHSPWLQPDATLQKPYTFEALLGTVKKVLATTQPLREPITLPAGQPGQAPTQSLQL